jgi:tRNA uridine 5-carboxymethylaminomethyl modification enzyme
MLKPNGIEDRSLQALGHTPIAKPMPLADIMRRPTVRLSDLRRAAPEKVEPVLGSMSPGLLQRFEDELKYAAFVAREAREVARAETLADQLMPNTDGTVPGLRFEALEQLHRYRPKTFGEAQQIAGITAADISALLVHATRTELPSQ